MTDEEFRSNLEAHMKLREPYEAAAQRVHENPTPENKTEFERLHREFVASHNALGLPPMT